MSINLYNIVYELWGKLIVIDIYGNSLTYGWISQE